MDQLIDLALNVTAIVYLAIAAGMPYLVVASWGDESRRTEARSHGNSSAFYYNQQLILLMRRATTRLFWAAITCAIIVIAAWTIGYNQPLNTPLFFGGLGLGFAAGWLYRRRMHRQAELLLQYRKSLGAALIRSAQGTRVDNDPGNSDQGTP